MRARRKKEPLALVNCPQCGYSLQGLPASHRCPECGLQYTRDVRVFRAGVKVLPSAILLLCFIAQVFWVLIRGLPESGLVTTCLVVLWLGAMAGFWGLFLWRRAEVHVTPVGVEFWNIPGAPLMFAWDEIEEVKWSFVTGELVFDLADGSKRRLLGDGFFGSHRKTKEFVRIVNAWKEKRVKPVLVLPNSWRGSDSRT